MIFLIGLSLSIFVPICLFSSLWLSFGFFVIAPLIMWVIVSFLNFIVLHVYERVYEIAYFCS